MYVSENQAQYPHSILHYSLSLPSLPTFRLTLYPSLPTFYPTLTTQIFLTLTTHLSSHLHYTTSYSPGCVRLPLAVPSLPPPSLTTHLLIVQSVFVINVERALSGAIFCQGHHERVGVVPHQGGGPAHSLLAAHDAASALVHRDLAGEQGRWNGNNRGDGTLITGRWYVNNRGDGTLITGRWYVNRGGGTLTGEMAR